MFLFFVLSNPATTEIYTYCHTLSLHDALPIYPNSWLGSEVRGWHMDDPEVAFPLFERAQALGIKVIAIHKAVPLGPVPMEHYRVDDIDRSEKHTSELQSLMRISYAVSCLNKKQTQKNTPLHYPHNTTAA